MSKQYAVIAEARVKWWSQFSSIEQGKSAWEGERDNIAIEADGQQLHIPDELYTLEV